MRRFFKSFYGKLSALFLLLLILMGSAQIWITFSSSLASQSVTGQTLNYELARDMLPDFNRFTGDTINWDGIKEMIHYMMVINPSIELYMLDDDGRILAFFAEPDAKVQIEQVNLEPVRTFLHAHETTPMPILGIDPRQPEKHKPFSAAPLKVGPDTEGYLYVILESEQFDDAASAAQKGLLLQTIVTGLIITLIFTGIIGLILFAFLTRRLRRITSVVQDFESGQFERRVRDHSEDELGQLGRTFNGMASTILANMEELKRTDRVRRELVANVSHDLRSPLASIKGYLETIQMRADRMTAEERNQYLDVMHQITSRLEGLVEQLFELSKLDAMETIPHFEPVSVSDLVQDVIMKYRPAAEKKGILLEASVPEQLPLALADTALIERALSNLIENALSYTPDDGKVSIDVSVGSEYVRVQVRDTGIGIDAEDIPHIFDRFYRVERSRARSTGGAGLGLAITKKILDIHNSKISVDSQINVGTRFGFDLQAWSPRYS